MTQAPKQLEQMQAVLRAKHYSIRAERVYDVQTTMIYTHELNRGSKV
jgi:hypothetical protein